MHFHEISKISMKFLWKSMFSPHVLSKNTIFHRFPLEFQDFHKNSMKMHASTTYFHKKHDFQRIFIEKSNMPTIFSSQSASWDWLPTSFAPTTLKSQMPTTRNQQHHKKRTLRSVWTLVLRFPNYGNSDTCVWRHSPQNSHGKKNEDHLSIKIAALQSLQVTESFVKNHENANLPAALHQWMFGKAHASMKLTR